LPVARIGEEKVEEEKKEDEEEVQTFT